MHQSYGSQFDSVRVPYIKHDQVEGYSKSKVKHPAQTYFCKIHITKAPILE